MHNAASYGLIVALSIVSGLIHLIAGDRSNDRLLLIELGREVTDADRARSRRLIAINAAAWCAGVVGALLVPDSRWFLSTFPALMALPIVALLVETQALVRSLPQGRFSARFAVRLERPPLPIVYVFLPTQLAHLALVAGSMALFGILRARLPERVPLHFDAQGRVNRVGSPNELWFMAGVMVFLFLLQAGAVWMIGRERRALPADISEGDADRFAELQHRRRTLLVRVIESVLFFVNCGNAGLWLGGVALAKPEWHARGSHVIVGAVAVLVLGILVPTVWALPKLVEIQRRVRELGGWVALGTRPKGWVAGGLVYYAPEDPALFVPKLVGIGITFNFARRGTWLIVAALFVVPIALTVGPIVLAARQTRLREQRECTSPPPASREHPFSEDFESGQVGSWSSWHDGTGTLSGTGVTPDVYPIAGGRGASRFAARVAGTGFSKWGAAVGVRFPSRCVDVRTVDGVAFWARGTTPIRFAAVTPEVQPVEYGGRCRERCNDSYGRDLVLTNEWQRFVVRWDELAQGGWGASVPFSKNVMFYSFAVGKTPGTFEFWIDDLTNFVGNAPVSRD